MKTIEQIRVRTGSSNSPKDLGTLRQIAAAAAASLKEGKVELCRHESVTGDFAYFLYWNEAKIQADGSSLSIKIRKSLESFGIMDFTAWTLIE